MYTNTTVLGLASSKNQFQIEISLKWHSLIGWSDSRIKSLCIVFRLPAVCLTCKIVTVTQNETEPPPDVLSHTFLTPNFPPPDFLLLWKRLKNVQAIISLGPPEKNIPSSFWRRMENMVISWSLRGKAFPTVTCYSTPPNKIVKTVMEYFSGNTDILK